MLPSRAPLLIVPIRDRRQGRRILTIRNCAITMLAVAVVIASISIYSQRRRGEGRELFRTETPAANGVARNDDIISEGDAIDQNPPAPMLAAPAAREYVPLPAPAPATRITKITPAPPVVIEGHGTAIVGDGEAVKVIKAPATSTAPPPPLSGGIFKQQS
jgi:hypothetical protein